MPCKKLISETGKEGGGEREKRNENMPESRCDIGNMNSVHKLNCNSPAPVYLL